MTTLDTGTTRAWPGRLLAPVLLAGLALLAVMLLGAPSADAARAPTLSKSQALPHATKFVRTTARLAAQEDPQVLSYRWWVERPGTATSRRNRTIVDFDAKITLRYPDGSVTCKLIARVRRHVEGNQVVTSAYAARDVRPRDCSAH